MNNLIIFTDNPPLKEKGFGFSVLLYHLLTNIKEKVSLLVTSNTIGVTPEDLKNMPSQSTLLVSSNLHKLTSKNKIKEYLDLLDFIFFLPIINNRVKKIKDRQLIFCIGASSLPIIKILIFQKLSYNNISAYIVDDFIDIPRITGSKIDKLINRYLTNNVLKKLKKIYVISDGLKQNLQHINNSIDLIYPKFSEIDRTSVNTQLHNTFNFTFTGGLSPLYNNSIKKFATILDELNNEQNQIEFKILIQTYSSKKDYIKLDLPLNISEYYTSEKRSYNLESYQNTDAFIVPYSYSENVKNLVSTSFPQKVAEIIQLNRPLLIFAPEYSSVFAFFKKNNIEYCIDCNASDKIIKSHILDFISITKEKNYFLEKYIKAYHDYFDPVILKNHYHELFC